MTPLSVIFDLDGTLVDSAPDLFAALDHCLIQVGGGPVDREALKPVISQGGRKMIETALADHGISLGQEALERLFEDFLAYYTEHISDHSRPYPGVKGALEALRQAQFRLGVCTNKTETLANRLLDSLGLTPFFDAVLGRDSLSVSKPHPGHLTGTVTRLGGHPSHSLMVGDSENDILAARAAGMPVIAVAFGYSHPPVAHFGPDRLITHYGQLVPAVRELFSPTQRRTLP